MRIEHLQLGWALIFTGLSSVLAYLAVASANSKEVNSADSNTKTVDTAFGAVTSGMAALYFFLLFARTNQDNQPAAESLLLPTPGV